jgi:hypothetical protein
MPLIYTTSYIEDARAILFYYKGLGEGAISQVSDLDLYELPNSEMNSIAIIVKHMAGNMLSRWTEFLSSDGEKPWRNRDQEFVEPPATRQGLMALWENGWNCLFGALEPLVEGDLGRTITIRGERHSVMQAVNRHIAHYGYHCGQIVLLAKYFQGAAWKTLSVPRNQSEEFNRRVLAGEASQR